MPARKTHCKRGHELTPANRVQGTGNCKTCISARRRAIYDPERNRNSQLRTRYGIDALWVQMTLREQDGRCAICREVFRGQPFVDHCHTTGAVRGLLCNPCNQGLGRFRDNETRLFNAVDYLRKHSQ